MTRHSQILTISILLFGLFSTGRAVAGMYKWTDAEGNVHYSQTPPDNAESQAVAPPPPAPISADQARKQLQKSQQVLNSPVNTPDNADHKGKQLTPSQLKALYEKNCAAAKANLQSYTAHRKFLNSSGQLTVLSNDERAAKVAESKQQIKQYCQ